jgi:hypothetical protein
MFKDNGEACICSFGFSSNETIFEGEKKMTQA